MAEGVDRVGGEEAGVVDGGAVVEDGEEGVVFGGDERVVDVHEAVCAA